MFLLQDSCDPQRAPPAAGDMGGEELGRKLVDSSRSALGTWTAQSHNWRGGGGGGDHLRRLQRITGAQPSFPHCWSRGEGGGALKNPVPAQAEEEEGTQGQLRLHQ